MSNFTPLPLDNAPLSETLLQHTPPIPSVEFEPPFFLATDRFSSYSSISSNRPDSFMSEVSSTRALNPLSDNSNRSSSRNGLGDRRLSNLSNLNYGISEEEKAEEEAIQTGGVKASVLPEGFSGGFGSSRYKKTSTFKRIIDGRGKWFILAGIILAIIIVGGAVGATISKKNNLVVAAGDGSSSTIGQTGTSTSNTPQSTSNSGSSTNSRATTGSNGSTVHADDGTTFIYNNTFGKLLLQSLKEPEICNEKQQLMQLFDQHFFFFFQGVFGTQFLLMIQLNLNLMYQHLINLVNTLIYLFLHSLLILQIN